MSTIGYYSIDFLPANEEDGEIIFWSENRAAALHATGR